MSIEEPTVDDGPRPVSPEHKAALIELAKEISRKIEMITGKPMDYVFVIMDPENLTALPIYTLQLLQAAELFKSLGQAMEDYTLTLGTPAHIKPN